MKNKKIDLLLASRRRQRRQPDEMDQFSRYFDQMVFMEDYFRAKFEAEGSMISEKEKEAKKKGEEDGKKNLLSKKFTIIQLMFWAWALSLPLAGFWYIVLNRLF